MIYYPPPMAPQPPTPSAPPIGAAEQERASGRRYQLIFGSIFAALTVLALLLAAIAPDLRPHTSQSLPAGWTPAYEGNLTAATATDFEAWDLTNGCLFYSDGLHAEAPDSDSVTCAFTPPGSSSATGQGFYFEVGLAPAWQVPMFQRALLLVGDPTGQSGTALTFEIGQDGSYTLCDNPCSATGRGFRESGGTAAWHGDAYVANTIAVKVSADHTHETIYVNGQQVATALVDLGAQPALAVGAPSGSGAIFTRVTLATGQ
ncbi:MAG TPA: hypothetical protein VFQ25_12525 [Ktedonobacterales bacterium]|nr:hypothetical protein [Ktedonobacterales bacterium]